MSGPTGANGVLHLAAPGPAQFLQKPERTPAFARLPAALSVLVALASPTIASTTLLQQVGLETRTLAEHPMARTARKIPSTRPAPNVASLTESLESRLLMAAVAGTPRPEGLVGHWTLDAVDVVGNLALDRAGRNRHGVVGGGASGATGRVREGMALDGIDDRVLLGGVLSGGASQLTAAAWVNKADSTSDALVVAKTPAASESDPDYAWSLGVAGDVVRVRLHGAAGLATFDGPKIRANRWHHLAFTYDGSAVRFYVDGRVRGAQSHAGEIAASGAQAAIGASGGATPEGLFKGRVDEVRVYDRALSGRSVLNLVYRPPGRASSPAGPLIREDFESTGDGLVGVDGTWTTSGGAYRATAAGTAATSHLNTRAVHDVAVTGDFTLLAEASVAPTASAWNDYGVVFNYEDPDNYYFFSSNETNDAQTSGLFKVVNGVSTELADAAGTIAGGATYRLRIEREGEQIRVYRDDALVAGAADATFTSGRVGFGTKGDLAAFDNLLVFGAPAAPSPTTPPAAPSQLTATANGASRIDLSWTDNSADERGFKIERSPDGAAWSQVGTAGANATAYSATGLSASTTYHFRVRAYNAAGDSAYTASASATTAAAPAGGVLAAPPRAAVDAAVAAPLIRYDRDISGGAHTNGAWFGGASFVLALASHAGDSSADARLLQQARYTLTGGNDISANGGYPAQHEVLVTAMFAVMRQTPRVWGQLTAAERHRADLLMKAALVSGAFTTGDANPYVQSGQQQRTLDGDTNVNRGWNPNYREGMVGNVLAGAAYFGVEGAKQALASYDHAAFVAELAAAGLSNVHETFNWKAANPSSIAPSGATVQSTVRAPYRWLGKGLDDVMGMYGQLAADTYSKAVSPGLNDGAGISGYGRIASGAESLPNRGQIGMLKEFDGNDAEGRRSSASYAYYGYRPHTVNALTLIACGLWDGGADAARLARARLEVGNTDLWYKVDRGYLNYAKGGPAGTFSQADNAATWGFAYTRPLWADVLRPYLMENVAP
jgi:hypothetical protein